MRSNIKEIKLGEGIKTDNLRPVEIHLLKGHTSTSLTIQQLLYILELWIIGEELKYPPSDNIRGRWMIFDLIYKVFRETPYPPKK